MSRPSPSDTSLSSSNDGAPAWGAPFHFPGGDSACLLIHGFTATPQEMRFLGERLHAAGHTVYGARVAGHGTSVEDLELSSWRDWQSSVREQLAELRRQSSRVVVVGQSMGGLLALALAADFPSEVDALVLLAPAIILQRRWLQHTRLVLPILATLTGERYRYLPKGRSDIADASQLVDRQCYDRTPLRAFHQLLSLQRDVRRKLRRIQQPTLVVHSRQDHTCSPLSVPYLQRRLGGSVETLLLDASYHVVSVDHDREQVAAAVHTFTTKIHKLKAEPTGFGAP